MSKYAALVSSIVNNPSKHAVDRDDKMNRTLNVMCSNLEKKAKQRENIGSLELKQDDRGYGEGRRMGD